MFRPIAAIFRLLQFCSNSITYMPILWGDAEISSSLRVTISLFSGMSNGQWLVGCTFMGRYWGRGLFGGRVNRLCCLWYSVGLGVRGLWVSVFDIFWVLFRVVVLGRVFWLQVSIVCVCVCVSGVRVRAWLGAFGVSSGDKNILTNVKECREGKLIWRVALF